MNNKRNVEKVCINNVKENCIFMKLIYRILENVINLNLYCKSQYCIQKKQYNLSNMCIFEHRNSKNAWMANKNNDFYL